MHVNVMLLFVEPNIRGLGGWNEKLDMFSESVSHQRGEGEVA